MNAPTQLEFFEVSQSRLPDGRIVLTPIRYAGRTDDIDMDQAARLLNGMDRKKIKLLIEIGEISAWRPVGRRTKYRIDRGSVLAYRERQRVVRAG